MDDAYGPLIIMPRDKKLMYNAPVLLTNQNIKYTYTPSLINAERYKHALLTKRLNIRDIFFKM